MKSDKLLPVRGRIHDSVRRNGCSTTNRRQLRSIRMDLLRAKRSGHVTLPLLLLEILLVVVVVWLGFLGCRSMLVPDQGGNAPESQRDTQQIMRMVVTSDGNQLWCQLGMCEIISLDLTTNRAQPVYRRRNHAIGNWGVSYDGRTVLVSNHDREVEITRDEETIVSEQLPDCQRLLTELSSTGMAAIRIADGTSARFWNLSLENSMVVDFKLQESAAKIALDAAGIYLATTSFPHGIHLYDVVNGAKIRALDDDTRHVKSLHLSDDGKYLAVVRESNVIVYDVSTGERLWVRKLEATVPFVCISFSRDSQWIAASAPEVGIHVFNAANGQVCSRVLTDSTPQRIAFSPTGELIHSASLTGIIRNWSIADEQQTDESDLLQLLEDSRKKNR